MQNNFGVSASVSTPKYRAFISYSSKDQQFARRLHRDLENISCPNEAVSGKTVKLKPIFRDREELSAGHDLNKLVEDALNDSSALVVFATKQSISSRWVKKEVEAFTRKHSQNRIFFFLPNQAEDVAPSKLIEVFNLTAEPLIADARAGQDGWSRAVAKVAAGILDVPFDLIWQRHLRDQRRMQFVRAGVLIVLAFLGLQIWMASQKTKGLLEGIEYTKEAQQEWDANKQELYHETILYNLDVQKLKNVQNILKKKGYYNGKIDGVRGPKTTAAIKKFREHEGLGEAEADDEIDAALLDALGLPLQ